MTLAAVFWIAAGLVVYTWAGYPLLLAMVARLRRPREQRVGPRPSLSVVVAAYNEAAWIEAKLDSTFAQRVPHDSLEVVVVSDGSTDATDALVSRFPDDRVRLIRQEPRAGKSAALNRGVAAARGDILVFTDANALFAPGALPRLAAPFRDPRVGLVSGVGLYRTSAAGGARGVGNGYARFESAIRAGESALGFLAGADGAIYAVRRSLWTPLEPAEVNDLLHPIQTALAGLQCRFAPEACTLEPPPADAAAEFRRQVRIIAQGFHLTWRWLPRLVARRRLAAVWMLLSHRLLRWTTALWLALALGANLALLGAGPIYAATLAAQGAFYALAVAGFAAERAGARARILALPWYFCVVCAAGVAGLARWLRGGADATWAPRGEIVRDRAA